METALSQGAGTLARIQQVTSFLEWGTMLTFLPDIRANHGQILNLVRNICECTHLPLCWALKVWKRERYAFQFVTEVGSEQRNKEKHLCLNLPSDFQYNFCVSYSVSLTQFPHL